MTIIVGKEYRITNTPDKCTIVITDRVGHLFIGTSGDLGAKYIVDSDGQFIAGYNPLNQHMDADNQNLKKWRVAQPKKIEYKLLYKDAVLGEWRSLNRYSIPDADVIGGFVRVENETPNFFNSRSDFLLAMNNAREYI